MIPVDTNDYIEDDAEDDGRPSKSQKKRDMAALQDLGAALVELSTAQLKKIEMPDDLRLAVREAKRITPRTEGRRRQVQYIGRLMRKADPEPIRAALDEIAGKSSAATARMHALERWRLRLLEDDKVIGEIAVAHPGVDIQQLRQLRRNALKETELGKPPRAFREIFRILKALDEEAAASAAENAEDSENDEE